MRFGLFMAPFHPVGQNPTLALERDLELVVHLDRLGFDEAWVGEHHSAGYEIIASPEVFIGVAAERTRHIKLGTGVSSLPYHHPLMLADRMVLLDHLTRGRTMLGVGPGQLTSDAHMLGIPSEEQRPRMEESLDAIMALLRGDVVNMETAGFVLRDARLQLRPYSDPCFDIAVAASFSPTGARAAGRHGIGMLSIAATAKQGMDLLSHHWSLWEEIALANGHVADRSRWRLVGPMHLAETREQAERDVEYGIAEFSRYFTHVLPAGPVQGNTPREIIDNNTAQGFAVIGTPDDAIAKIDELVDASGGGFGAFLLFGHDWATAEATKRSFELFAQYVMPRYQGQLEPPAASCEWVTGSGGEFVNRAAQAIQRAIEDHASERTAAPAPADHTREREPVTTPVATRVVASSGLGLAVYDWGGDGPPTLLAHPTGFHGRVWEPAASRLAAAGRRVWSFDFRGHGDSDRSRDGYAWSGFADDVLTVTDQLGIARDPELLAVGHSKGAAALLLGELAAPGTYRRVWGYEPAMHPTDEPMPTHRENPLSVGARKRRAVWSSRDEAYSAYASKPPLDVLTPEALHAYVAGGLRERPDGRWELKCAPDDEAQMYAMGATHGAFARLGGVGSSVVVVCGERSGSIGPAFSAAIAERLPRGHLEVLPGLGHFGPMEDPDACVASMLRFARM